MNTIYISVRLKGDYILLQNKVSTRYAEDENRWDVAKEAAFDLANFNSKTLIKPENIEYSYVELLSDPITDWHILQDINIDLFEYYEKLPADIQNLIEEMGEDVYGDRSTSLNDWLVKFEAVGYTFDWGLDYEPYDLRELTDKEKDFEAFKNNMNDNNYHVIIDDVEKIEEHLKSINSTCWGQGLINNFYLLVSTSPLHKGDKGMKVYCHYNDLNKVCEKQYENLKETKSNFAVKKLDKDYHHLVVDLPNFDKTGSITGMKKLYYGKQALLVRCGDYIYNVSSEPAIYFKLAK